jgi:pimeloyl-ACP methyl ester carboxylesterase
VAPTVVIVLDQAGVGCGVATGVGVGLGVGVAAGEGDAEADGPGDGDADASGVVDAEADGLGEVVSRLVGVAAVGVAAPSAQGSSPARAGVTRAKAGLAASANTSTPSTADQRRRGRRRRAGAARSDLAINMLPSLLVRPATGHGPKGPGSAGRWYQHGTVSSTVSAMSRVLLAHGSSGSPESMAPWVEGLRARGVAADAVAIPRGLAERGIRPFAEQVPDEPLVAVGGHSLGGRVATLLAAGILPPKGGLPPRHHPIAGVVALSYPLHAPHRPDPTLARAAHFASIDVPVLLLSGDADPFARIDLLREAVGQLRDGRLTVYPRLGHGVAPQREDALDRIAAFVRELGG